MPTELATRGVWQAWFHWTTGEFAGFLVPALVGALTSSAELLVLAGVVEGAVLGAAQAVVLRRVLCAPQSWDWIGATAVVAGFAWAVAMIAVHNGERLNSLPLVVLLPLSAVAGTGVLLSIGVVQRFVLRVHVHRSHARSHRAHRRDRRPADGRDHRCRARSPREERLTPARSRK